MKKKIFILLLTLIMVFTLAACGQSDDETAKNKVGEIVNEEVEKAEEFEAFSVEAFEYFLSETVDLELADVEPDWEWGLKSDYSAYGDSPDSGYGHAVISFSRNGEEITDEEIDEYYKKVFEATAAVSDDGYNVIGYEFVGESEDALSETTLEDALGGFLKGWAFRKDGSMMVVYVDSGYDNEKESEYDRLFYYDSVKVDIGFGLQKSWDDTMSDIEEHADEIEDALN